jgi:hypothetical protein
MNAHYIPTLFSDGIVTEHILSAPPLPGRPHQSVYEESDVQNYPIGTRYQQGDRTFHYCLAGGTTAVAMKAGHNGTADVGVNTYAQVYPIGTTEIRIEDTATRAAHYYQNGYLWVMDLISGVYQMYKIKDSEEALAADDHVHLTLYEPIPIAIPASTWVTAWPNPFSNILFTTSDFSAQMCVPLIPVTTGHYFWGQTWGPCFGTAMSVLPGVTAGDREVYFNSDGALEAGVDVDAKVVMNQRAGFVITMTSGGGDQFYMLQIAP